MEYALIGLIVGLIMGLTGAGGALISIPLFINLTGASLKEATLLSLLAVLFGTSISLYKQFSKVSWKIVIGFSMAGLVANYLSLPLKIITPDFVIAMILLLIGGFSIYSVWKKKNYQSTDTRHFVLKIILIGAFLGVLTTLTGLGGGVLLVPILLMFFGKSYEQALPTSLATIFIISLSSLVLQFESSGLILRPSDLTGIGIGAIISFLGLKLLLKHVHADKIDIIRRYTFTLVTVYAVGSVIVKTISG